MPQAQAERPQIQPGASRPKIGIALEGGGALGLAHIGVLQWFEDHHIPIDYLAGTSMGGLVGGLYATGKSPQELKEIVAEQKWDIIIGGEIPYQDLSYRRKEDLRAIQNSLKLGLKHGLSTPSGLNSGSEITLLIDRETLSYPRLDSFDSLPIPFRCVATDLVSGKEVVFSNGSLQQALRATMSMPGVFSPVRDGEKIYVDGGLVGNLPTDVVRKMGADIVIGVHLEVAPGNPKEIQSFFSVLGRSVDVVVLENELRGMKDADIVVTVPLEKYNGFQYDRAAAIIQEGTQAAEQKKGFCHDFPFERCRMERLRSGEERANPNRSSDASIRGGGGNQSSRRAADREIPEPTGGASDRQWRNEPALIPAYGNRKICLSGLSLCDPRRRKRPGGYGPRIQLCSADSAARFCDRRNRKR